jgi:glycosyltransferase involved in cell wall biosynthesis
MARILIDLTDLEQWTGVYGGIQRVVYAIAENLALQEPSLGHDVQFITFSPYKGEFYFTSFTSISARVARSLPDQKPSVEDTPGRGLIRARAFVKLHLPDWVRANRLARAIADQVISFLARGASKFAPPSRRPVAFHEDDIVLIAGKPWSIRGLHESLALQRASVGFRLVQVVHDLVPCLYPHLHDPGMSAPYTQHITNVVRHSDLLLAVSRSTESDLQRFSELVGLTPPPIRVIRLGDGLSGNTASGRKPSSGIRPKFIACVGTLEIRKNHMLLYYVYKLASQMGRQLPQLVIIGNRGWLTEQVHYLLTNDPSVKSKILILHDIDDNGLDWIYENCLFTVYPSMYEGWGLPIAESLAHGKLCVASNSSSMPEIAGDLAEYFSPYSPEECLERISSCLDARHLGEREQRIRATYKPVQWSQTARQIGQYLQEMKQGILL